MKKYILFFIASTILILTNCSREKSDWQNAKTQNTLQIFEQFLITYPNSTLRDSATIKIEELYFNDAKEQNITQAYQQFIVKYPNSIFKDTVINKMRQLEFYEIYDKKDIPGIKKFISNYPDATILNTYKIKESATISSQSKDVNKGCKFILKELNENEFTYLLTVPPSTSFNLDISIGLDVSVNIVKGDLLVDIQNGSTSGYKSSGGGTLLSITINKNNYIKLNSEFIEIMPNLLIYLDKSEFMISGNDSVLLKRDVSKNEVFIEKRKYLLF